MKQMWWFKLFFFLPLVVLAEIDLELDDEEPIATPRRSSNRSSNSSRPVNRRRPASLVNDQFKLSLGMDRATFNFGAEYETRTGNTAVNAYALIAGESLSAGKVGMTIIGGSMPIYIFDNRQHSFAVAPGFGLNMISLAGTSEMGLGPHFKMSLAHRISPTMKWGLEHLTTTNWLAQKALGNQNIVYVNLGFSL